MSNQVCSWAPCSALSQRYLEIRLYHRQCCSNSDLGMVWVIGCHHYKWSTFTWKINVTVRRLIIPQGVKVKAITVWKCGIYATFFLKWSRSLLKFRQSFGNVTAYREFNHKGSTHTLRTERSLSLGLIYYGILYDWDYNLKVEESVQKFDKRTKVVCMFVCGKCWYVSLLEDKQ